MSNLETNSSQESQNGPKSNEILSKIKTEVEENSNVIEISPKMRECRVILRSIRHDTEKNETGTRQEVKHEPEKQFLIILSPQRIIKPHKPIKIEEEDDDDSETDKLQCQICNKKYSSVVSLRNHKNIHNKRFGCQICCKKYPIKSCLLKHIRNVHENPRSFKCHVCKVRLSTKECLKRHQRVHIKNRPKPFECSKCDYATDLKHSLNKHLMRHERKIGKCKKFVRILIKNRSHDCRVDCKYCGKKFSHAGNALSHIKKHHAIETERSFYKCDICGLKFKRKIFLMYHMEAKHPDGKLHLFTCDLDGKTFNFKSQIDKHMKCHLLPGKCKFCLKKLSIRQLKQHIINFHMRTKQKSKKPISKTKSFQCQICSKILSTKRNLNMHISNHNKRIKCKFCEKLFGTQSRFKIHIRDCHENPNSFSCEICDKKYFQRSNLTTHMKVHDQNRKRNIKCSQCDFATDNKHSFMNHFYFHKKNHIRFAIIKKSHKCLQCPVVKRTQSSLNWHIYYVHTKNLIECDICGRKVKSKKSMLQHFKLAHKIGL